MKSYERLRQDWFSLLRQGEWLAGKANCDSHFLSKPVAAPPIWMDADADGQWTAPGLGRRRRD